MIMNLLIDKETKRILDFSDIEIVPCDGRFVVEAEIEDITNLLNSIYENGKVIFKKELQEEFEIQQQIIEDIDAGVELFSVILKKQVLNSATDIQAFTMRYLFDEWSADTDYEVNDRVMYLDKFYKCLSSHTSNATLKPTDANYLWVEISNPNEEWPKWKQPLGYADAYSKGDKVTFEEKHYESLIDGNTYSPRDYPQGWKLVD